MAKVVKVDGGIMDLARRTLLEELLAGRLRTTHSDAGRVTGFADPGAVERFGVTMERVTDKTLTEQALILLARTVRAAPKGQTGIAYFDQD